MLMVWICVTLLSIGIELLTPSALVSIWFAIGGIVALILEMLNLPLSSQVIAFLGVSIISMLVVRPIATRYLRGNIVATNADRVVGSIGKVTKTIEEDSWGEVYINATYWSAVEVDNQIVQKGSKVKILAIEGAKLIVKTI